MKSPVISARDPFDVSSTLQWPGVCPGVETSVTPGAISASTSTRSTRPASTTGWIESSCSGRWWYGSTDQWRYSGPANR